MVFIKDHSHHSKHAVIKHEISQHEEVRREKHKDKTTARVAHRQQQRHATGIAITKDLEYGGFIALGLGAAAVALRTLF
jgi:hypothetical protein